MFTCKYIKREDLLLTDSHLERGYLLAAYPRS